MRAVLKNVGMSMDRYEHFSTFSYTKSELKGNLLDEKIILPVFGSLQCMPFWANEGVSQSAQIGPILTFLNQENDKKSRKSKFNRGGIFYEKIAI